MVSNEVTDMLRELSDGDTAVREELWSAVYDELRRVAGDLMKGERHGHTLQPTALVNETYIRLVDLNRVSYKDRRHFFALAARMMRRILVEHARANRRKKRDGGTRITLELGINLASKPDADMLDLNEAMKKLEAIEKEKADVVELRFFGGLTVEETAQVIGRSEKTVRRHWKVARLWLYRELVSSVDNGP
jgi:RNA polymerase sigma factor (TIGR02999 family)